MPWMKRSWLCRPFPNPGRAATADAVCISIPHPENAWFGVSCRGAGEGDWTVPCPSPKPRNSASMECGPNGSVPQMTVKPLWKSTLSASILLAARACGRCGRKSGKTSKRREVLCWKVHRRETRFADRCQIKGGRNIFRRKTTILSARNITISSDFQKEFSSEMNSHDSV